MKLKTKATTIDELMTSRMRSMTPDRYSYSSSHLQIVMQMNMVRDTRRPPSHHLASFAFSAVGAFAIGRQRVCDCEKTFASSSFATLSLSLVFRVLLGEAGETLLVLSPRSEGQYALFTNLVETATTDL